MAACRDFEGLIAASVYGALEPSEARAFDRHLVECAECRRERDELGRVARLIGTGDARELDAQARRDVLHAIAQKTRQQTARFRRGPAAAPANWSGRAALAAGFLAAFVGIVLIARLTDRTSSHDVAVEPTPTDPATLPPAPVPAPKPEFAKPPDLKPEPKPAPVPEPTPALKPPEPPSPTPKPPEAPPAEKPAPPAEATPPRERTTLTVMARLERAQGNVTVNGAAAKEALDLVPGQEIHVTGRSAFASVKCTDGTRLDLYGDTTLRLVSDRQAGAGRTVLVLSGLVAAEVTKQPAAQPMIFQTPTAEAKVLGTTLKLDVRADVTRLEVREGRVRLTRKEDGSFTDVAHDQVAVAAKGVALASRPARVHAGLVALYSFDEAQGNVVRDVSGAGLPLDLRGKNMTWEAGALSLREKARISSDDPAAKIIEACRKTNELAVEAWVRPARAALDFEGCIVGLSNDVTDRNFALVQGDGGDPSVYSFSLRTSTTDGGGRPHVVTPKGTVEARLTHLVYVRHANGLERLYVNGVERAGKSRSGTFAAWDDSYHLHLGNERTEERPWLGEYRLVAVYGRALVPAEVARNFKLGVD